MHFSDKSIPIAVEDHLVRNYGELVLGLVNLVLLRFCIIFSWLSVPVQFTGCVEWVVNLFAVSWLFMQLFQRRLQHHPG